MAWGPGIVRIPPGWFETGAWLKNRIEWVCNSPVVFRLNNYIKYPSLPFFLSFFSFIHTHTQHLDHLFLFLPPSLDCEPSQGQDHRITSLCSYSQHLAQSLSGTWTLSRLCRTIAFLWVLSLGHSLWLPSKYEKVTLEELTLQLRYNFSLLYFVSLNFSH